MSGECRSSHFVVVVVVLTFICLLLFTLLGLRCRMQSFSGFGENVDFLPMAFAKYVPF